MVEVLERAASDGRVVGLFARVSAFAERPVALARVQELRDAVLAFRSSGKPAVAFCETLGEFGPGTAACYLASAFDRVVLQPIGDVGLVGSYLPSPFLRGVLDKLGVEARMDHRYEYKTALNQVTERHLTESHREALQRIVDSQLGQIVTGIAEGRGLDSARVRDLVEAGPFFAEEALAAGLVDGLGYRDQVVDDVKQRTGGKLVPLARYRRRDRPRRGATVALVYGVGPSSSASGVPARSAASPNSPPTRSGRRCGRPGATGGQGDPLPGRQPGRVGRRFRRRVARGRPAQGDGQAGRRLDGRRGRFRRLLRGDGRRQDRRRSRPRSPARSAWSAASLRGRGWGTRSG